MYFEFCTDIFKRIQMLSNKCKIVARERMFENRIRLSLLNSDSSPFNILIKIFVDTKNTCIAHNFTDSILIRIAILVITLYHFVYLNFFIIFSELVPMLTEVLKYNKRKEFLFYAETSVDRPLLYAVICTRLSLIYPSKANILALNNP